MLFNPAFEELGLLLIDAAICRQACSDAEQGIARTPVDPGLMIETAVLEFLMQIDHDATLLNLRFQPAGCSTCSDPG
ncbi:hypothetical protein D3C80_1826240 [compost metagenome]